MALQLFYDTRHIFLQVLEPAQITTFLGFLFLQ